MGARVDTPLLIVPGDPDGSMRVQLRAVASDKQEWTVGSEGEREILIKRLGVSALHAKIVNDGSGGRSSISCRPMARSSMASAATSAT